MEDTTSNLTMDQDEMTLSILVGAMCRSDEEDLSQSQIDTVIGKTTTKLNVGATGDCFFLVLFLTLLIRGDHKVRHFLGQCIDAEGLFSIKMWRSLCAYACIPQLRGVNGRGVTFPESKWDNYVNCGYCSDEGTALAAIDEIYKDIRTPGKEIDEHHQEFVLYGLSRWADCLFVVTGLPFTRSQMYCAPVNLRDCRDICKVPAHVIEYSYTSSGHYSPRVHLAYASDFKLRELLTEPFTGLGTFKDEYLGLEGAMLYKKNLTTVYKYVWSKSVEQEEQSRIQAEIRRLERELALLESSRRDSENIRVFLVQRHEQKK